MPAQASYRNVEAAAVHGATVSHWIDARRLSSPKALRAGPLRALEKIPSSYPVTCLNCADSLLRDVLSTVSLVFSSIGKTLATEEFVTR